MATTTYRFLIALAASLALAGSALAGADITTTFDSGTEGWSVSGRDTISQTGGNPGANLDVTVEDVWGASIQNFANAGFMGDFGRFGSALELSVDVKVNSIWMLDLDGEPFEVPRNLIVELVDFNAPEDPYPYTSVWFNLGEIGSHLPGWRHFSVVVDPSSVEMPDGWGGTGAEDPVTFEPMLPEGRTFASVMENVEEIRFTTMEPGFFYAAANFVLQVDNPSLRSVPEPAAGLTGLGMLGILLMRRRR